ncbi:MAG: hypothetical protein IJ631_02565 [Schwartzia sp.]|nr:hypothetical protein [Schwartzia sp. (in: firmicutes)]
MDGAKEKNNSQEHGRHDIISSKKKVREGRGTNIELSPKGINRFIVRGFKNQQKMMNHWKNGRTHREEYPELETAEEYERKALALLESPVGGDIVGHIDKNGIIVRYNKRTNDFAKCHPLKGIRTMFKPIEGEKYYWTRKEEDMQYGGKD